MMYYNCQHCSKPIKKINEYLYQLNQASHYRETSHAAGEVIHIIENTHYVALIGNIYYLYGSSLRILHEREQEAVHALERALSLASINTPKSWKAKVLSSLSMGYADVNDMVAAQRAATQVLALSSPKSSYNYSAKLTLINCDKTLLLDQRISRIKSIETRARKDKCSIPANNAAMLLANLSKDESTRLGYLNKVLTSGNKISYNQMRAIIMKCEHLIQQEKISTIAPREKLLIHTSYSLLFRQRMSHLFNKCSVVLLEMLMYARDVRACFRLFRYCSLIWRLYNERAEEMDLIEVLIDYYNSLSTLDRETVNLLDYQYLQIRKETLVSET